MSSVRLSRWLAAMGLWAGLILALPAAAQTHPLTLRIRDAQSGLPAAARVHLTRDGLRLLDAPDPVLRTHRSPRTGAYVHVLDSLVVDLPAGEVDILAVRGTEGIPTFDSLDLQGPTVHTVFVDDWIDAKTLGWYGGDPHVHADHVQGAEYPATTLAQVARAARAEGLDVMALLDNDPSHPGGPVLPPWPETTLLWGEEYRAAYWGHVVLLGLDSLVLTGQTAGCCSDEVSVWPTLQGQFEGRNIPLVLLAHPQTTHFLSDASDWPGGGHGREMRSLALGDDFHGMAVAGVTMTPGPWAVDELLDVLRAGARWAAVGEGDRPLDRWLTSAPGMPRTYARLDMAYAPGDTALGSAWTQAVRARRCFASTGPLLHTVQLDGAEMGGTLVSPGGGSFDLSLGFASYGSITDLWIHDSQGTPLHWNWPDGRAALDTTIAWSASHDDFLVVEIAGPGDDWPGVEFAPRAVSSPVWIDAGTPWPWREGVARRGADELAEVWEIATVDRFFDSAAESLAARAQILGSAQFYENAFDDPPAGIALLAPANAAHLQVLGTTLEWSASFSYDGEPLTYRVTVARDAGFADVVADQVTSNPSYFVAGLQANTEYYWRVSAMEPEFESVLALNAPFTFTVDDMAVGVPERASARFALRSGAHAAGSLSAALDLGRAAEVRLEVVDVRGRRVRRLFTGSLDAGVHSFGWDGRDRNGAPVARGLYWFLASSEGRQTSLKVLAIR